MTDETTSGREPVTIVRIDQPLCGNAFGVAPCTASAAAGGECFNTYSTCQDTANYALGAPLSLYFSKGNASDALSGVDAGKYVFPSLVSTSTQPTKINLAGANPNATGLGNRAVCRITFQDHPHTDRVVDPYQSTRTYDAYERGSMWSKWIVRNKYRQNILITIYDGYHGQALADMISRQYFLQSVSGPDSQGRVTITGKDVLAKLEERKAQVPVASPGVLYIDIADTDTTFEVAGAVLADYDTAGTLRIDDELMTYASTSLTTNGVTFATVVRGTDGTTADSHDANETVQQCVRYDNLPIADILEDLLETRAGIDAGYLNKTAWATEFGDYLASYNLTTIICEPTAVSKLVAALQIECQFYVWWDERTSLVEVKSIRGIDAEVTVISQEENIIAGSFATTEMPEQRSSQVWMHYDVRDFTLPIDAVKRYRTVALIADLGSEGANKYGEASVRTIHARFLQSGALATTTGSRILNRYVETPRQATFELDAKDRDFWVGDTIGISHRLDLDQFGAREISHWTITSAEEFVSGEKIRYTAEDTTVYGSINYVMAAGAADYSGYENAPFKNCYIGDADGLLSDGQKAGQIS